jgi:hypothetical protein
MNRQLYLCSLVCALVVILHPSPARSAQKDLNRSDHFPSAEGKVVTVDGADLDISVRSADVPDIQVDTDLHIGGVGEEKAQKWIDGHTPVFTDDDKTLTIKVDADKIGFLGFGYLSAKARLSVLAPSRIIPDLTTTSGSIHVRGDFPDAAPLRLRTSTGDMEFVGVASSVDVHSASGDVEIEVVRPLESFFVRTASGDVRLVGGSRLANVDTASGKIWLGALSGSVEASTSTGKITLRWDRLDAGEKVRIRSSSGAVQLEIPASTRPAGTLTTTTGNVRSDFPGEVTEDGSSLRLTGDGPVFDVETASGEIQLTIRD